MTIGTFQINYNPSSTFFPQLTGNDPSKGQTTVLKSYGGATSATRLVAPANAPGLSRITTIPPAIAVSLHSAAAVLVPNSQGIPLKTTMAQPKVNRLFYIKKYLQLNRIPYVLSHFIILL